MLISGMLFGGEIVLEMGFSPDDFNVIQVGEYTRIIGDDLVIIGDPGAPEMLAQPVNALIPPNTRATGLRVLSTRYEMLLENAYLPPFQPPTIRSLHEFGLEPELLQPDPDIYGIDEFLPLEPVRFSDAGNLSGYSISGFILYPIRYNPFRKEVEYLKSVTLALEYEDYDIPMPITRSPRSAMMFKRIVNNLVCNRQNIDEYEPSWILDAGAKDYAVVCAESYASGGTMQNFLRSIRRQGWNDTVVTMGSIMGFPGCDNAEKLRNALTNLYITEGIASVVLIGDIACRMSVPQRRALGFVEW